MTTDQAVEIRKAVRYLEHLLNEAGEDFDIRMDKRPHRFIQRARDLYIYRFQITLHEKTEIA